MRFLTYFLCALLSLIGIGTNARTATAGADIYGICFKTIDGKPASLAQYKGKVLLIVNTASRCGFTPQYAGLQKIYDAYKDKGLVVIGIPSNDFGGQEPGSESEIKKFCETNFNITFPLMSKEEVTGANAHPFFKQVRSELGVLASPHWNFYKYLNSRDGHLIAWFSSATKPESEALAKAISAQLAK